MQLFEVFIQTHVELSDEARSLNAFERGLADGGSGEDEPSSLAAGYKGAPPLKGARRERAAAAAAEARERTAAALSSARERIGDRAPEIKEVAPP